jgi:hypothetical protein
MLRYFPYESEKNENEMESEEKFCFRHAHTHIRTKYAHVIYIQTKPVKILFISIIILHEKNSSTVIVRWYEHRNFRTRLD